VTRTSTRPLVLSAALAALPAAAPADAPALSPPAIVTPAPQATAQRLHVLADPAGRTVTRRMVGVADAHPDLRLTFTWSPAPGNAGVDPDTGLAEGPGRLTWRIPGMADYDPRAVHHRFDGSLRAGRPHGPGEMRFRDGTVIAGTWADGLLEGAGSLRDTRGNRFEGAFVAGRAEGPGRFVAAEGWVYDGPFRDGRPDGAGRVTRPGGLAYDVTHEAGVKIASTRPHPLPDPLVGGLLPAQGGAMADRTTLAMTTDARIVAEQEWMLPYVFWNDGSRIQIYPGRDDMIDLWNGNLRIDDLWLVDDEQIIWDDTFAALRVDLQTTDGSRVELREVALEVERSTPYLKPMLRRVQHRGCLGFRPTFHLHNLGWGEVENPRATIRFVDQEAFYMGLPDVDYRSLPGTDSVPVAVDPFDLGVDVDLRAALHALGVDLAGLEREYFDCSAFPDADYSTAAEPVWPGEACLPTVLNTAAFGQLAPWVFTGQVFYTDGDWRDSSYTPPEGAITFSVFGMGELTYDWTNSFGEVITATEIFEVTIQLGVSERRMSMMAEMGAGGGFPVAAPDFVDVALPVEATDFRVATRPRGNPNVTNFAGLFRLHSTASSIHDFTAVAVFGDGSERRSLPATFYYLKPRFESFASQATPAKCLMPPLVWWDGGETDDGGQ